MPPGLARLCAAVDIRDAASVDARTDRIRQLLAEVRSRNWMAAILERSCEARDVVLTVGALRLPGEHGLLRLLAREGYAICRLSIF